MRKTFTTAELLCALVTLALALLDPPLASAASPFSLPAAQTIGPDVSAAVAAPPPQANLPGVISAVGDGDTLDVEFRFVIRFRLLADLAGRGCWAPESRTKDLAEKKRGLAAKEHLTGIALGKPCLVSIPLTSSRLIDYMTLERMLAVVWVDGRSLGAEQIRTKHASSTKSGKLGD